MRSGYYMPARIYSEKDCVKNHSEELRFGSHALIVTGKNSSKKNHSLEDVTAALEKNNIRYKGTFVKCGWTVYFRLACLLGSRILDDGLVRKCCWCRQIVN